MGALVSIFIVTINVENSKLQARPHLYCPIFNVKDSPDK